MYYTANLNDKNVNPAEKLIMIDHANYESDMAFHLEEKDSEIANNLAKDMRRLFINGKMSTFWLTECGEILKLDKKTSANYLIKWDKQTKQYMFVKGRGCDLKESIPFAHLMAEHFLLEGAPIKAFEISYKNNKKSPNMCALNNLIVKKVGIGTVAVKKAVKVMRKGRFYAYYDSVKACAEDLQIPSRKVSEIVKSGEKYNHFVVEVF